MPRKMSRLTRLKNLLFAIKSMSWTPIRKCEVLQFGGREPTVLAVLSDDFSIGCMAQVGQSLNIWVLLEAIFMRKWGRFGYYSIYIRRSQAKIILVWHDTNIEAFELSRHTSVPVACIQNGVRVDLAPAHKEGHFSSLIKFNAKRKAQIHTYFVLSESERKRLSRFIDSRYVVHGSIRANQFAIAARGESLDRSVKMLGLIVSFPNSQDVPTKTILGNLNPFVSVGESVLSYDSYFSYDAVVARAVSDICAERQIEFFIIGKRSSDDRLESDFFSTTVSSNVRVIGHPKGDGYSAADEFDYLVAIDSSLGFEMLGLGKSVAFLPNRLRFCGIDAPLTGLSFLDELPSDGACWSSAITEEAIRVFLGQWLDRQPSADDSDITAFKSRVISVDPGNSKLRSYLRDCISASS